MLGANGDFTSYNLFAYCSDNPVINKDDNGAFFFTVLGAITGFVGSVATSLIMGENYETAIDNGLAGALGGAIAGAGIDIGLIVVSSGGVAAPIAAAGIAYLMGGAGNVITTEMTAKEKPKAEEIVGSFIIGGTFNLLSFGTSLVSAARTFDKIAVNAVLNMNENIVVGTSISLSTSTGTYIGTRGTNKDWIELR